MRSEYDLKITVNSRKIKKVIIDQHYREKHSEHMSDHLILEVLKEIDGQIFDVVAEDKDYQYFKVEPVILNDMPYRIIYLLFINEDTLGVINCFRVSRRKL